MSRRYEEMSWSLTDLVVDMTTPSVVFEEFDQSPEFVPDSPKYLAINRMCLSHIIIALCKFDEIFVEYSEEFKAMPKPLYEDLKRIKKEIERRNIYKFRSIYVGHAFKEDRKGKKVLSKKPLSLNEGNERLNKIVANDYLDFYDWICPQNIASSDGTSVVEIITGARDFCNKQFTNKSGRL
ncbi:hypothetical protein [Vibrio campbellii]|uniref:hypothetical protein n=1 Tax=Vibrio campbellii TaxID=680 RepID=UPI000CD334AD|nr:hypothetical protein [Vibrio campbellii]AUW07575.1 hypothetical protein C1N51_28565 [Vibrio campbellii]